MYVLSLSRRSQPLTSAMLVPMFNAELAPPGIRGSLVALQQLAITLGILVR